MRVLSLNCRGLGQALTVRTARYLVINNRIDLVFLMETKCKTSQLSCLGLNMGFGFYCGVDALGTKGGLWAAWNSNFHISVNKISRRFLVLHVKDDQDRPWCLVLLYGHPVVSSRNVVWEELSSFLSGVSTLVIIVGNYNQVFDPSDKWSSNTRQIPGLANGNMFLSNNRLINLTTKGVPFSWTNARIGRAAT